LLDLDLDLGSKDSDLDLDLAVAGLVTSLVFSVAKHFWLSSGVGLTMTAPSPEALKVSPIEKSYTL